LKDMLLGLDEDWHVWTDWYEDRLAGSAAGRRLIPELELDRILVPDFDAPAAEVNATIAALERKYREPAPEPSPDPDTATTIPEQHPAVIEVTLGDDGLLHRAPPRGLGEDNAGREEVLREAWQAHRDLLDDLLTLDPGRNWPVLKTVLTAYDRALGKSFEEFRAIALGTHGLRVNGLAGVADQTLMDDMAQEVRSLALSHGLFIGQFNEWRDYLSEARGDPAPDAAAAASGFLREMQNHSEVIAPDVAAPALEIAEAVEAVDSALESESAAPADLAMRRESLLSAGNILSGLVAPLRRFIGEAGASARQGSIKEFETAGKWATKAFVVLTTDAVSVLVGLQPEMFGWLPHAIQLLRTVFGV